VKLLILRHGQAGNAPAGSGDVDRPLTASGRLAVTALRAVVERLDPDLVLCSSALRTRQTVEALDLDPGVPVDLEPGLYGADADEMLEQIRAVDDDVATVLLVGHNPGVLQLVIELSDGEPMPAFRPATLAVLELDADRWSEAGPGAGHLVSMHVPDEAAS
jgi:phosphohistidine phosphatase